MASFRDYLKVSQRGYFTTRILTRPVASLLLAGIPKKLEKYISPNKISFAAFIVAQISNLIFATQLIQKSIPFYTAMFFWTTTQYLAYVLDCADGQFARQMRKTSVEGKFLDMILDLARELMRLLLFVYFLADLKHGYLVVVYLAFRAYWMSTWAAIYHLDSLKGPDENNAKDNVKPRHSLASQLKSRLLLCLSLPQDGFIDIFTSAILFSWIYQAKTYWGLSYSLLAFLFLSISINITLVFRRMMR